jgi:hypothetical protein
MISRPEFYAFLIMLLFVVIRFEEHLREIKKELKALREKITAR